jgi:hypothetical protein
MEATVSLVRFVLASVLSSAYTTIFDELARIIGVLNALRPPGASRQSGRG